MSKRFYAPAYLEEVYPEKCKEITESILEEYGDSGWDMFTSFESAEEVEDFIGDLV